MNSERMNFIAARRSPRGRGGCWPRAAVGRSFFSSLFVSDFVRRMYRALLAQPCNRPCNIRTRAEASSLVMPTSARIMLVVSASLLAGVNAMHQNRAPSHTDAHRRSHSSSHTRACGALTHNSPIFHAWHAELSHGMRTASFPPLLSLRSWVQATLPHFG